MLRRATAALVLLVAAGLPAACGGDDAGGPSAAAPAAEGATCTAAPLEDRAAAVLLVGLEDATTAEDPIAVELTDLGVAGVVLRQPNVVDADQLRSLVADLRAASPHGLLVAADEEGGRVSRLRALLGTTASARTLGREPLEAITAEAERRGAVLADLGVDLVLGPVVDADGGPADGTIGDRSFDADVTAAGAKAAAFTAGLTAAGLRSAAKHFPGQGAVGADSHVGEAASDLAGPALDASARAFLPAVAAGAGAVMVAHVTYPALGPLPASLEPAVYDLLRSLGFDGVAVTDSLGMGAVTQRWTIPQAAVLALAAGADLVLANQGPEARGMRDAIVAAVGDGSLPEARLDEAVARVQRFGGRDPADLVCP